MSDQDLKYRISADDRFSRVFATLRRDMTDTRDVLRGIGSGVAAVTGPLAVVVAVGGAAALAVKRVADNLDELNDAADATGSAIDRFAALDRLARQNNESTGLVTNALLKLNKTLKDGDPDSPIGRALRRLNLDVKALRELDPADALQVVARALAGFAEGGNKARITETLFGKSTRDVAGFLRDLAAASDLGSVSIARQAAEAELFNKQLARLSVELNDAARNIVSGFLPAINEMFLRIKAMREEYGSLTAGLAENLFAKTFDDPAKGVGFYAEQLRVLQINLERLRREGGDREDSALAGEFKVTADEINRATRALGFYRRLYADVLAQQASDPRNDPRRGRGFVGLPSAPDIPDGPTTPKVSEAQRLLETLQRQAAGYDQLGMAARLAFDIQNKAIDGLTPKLQKQLQLLAEAIDARSQSAIKDPQQQQLQDFLRSEKAAYEDIARLQRDADQADSSLLKSLLDDTDVARVARARQEIDLLRKALNAPGVTAEGAAQIGEALDAAIERAKGLQEAGKDTFAELLAAVDRFADGTIEAILDMSETGEANFGSLFRAFRRDVLRELIEDPVRDSMKEVVKIIKEELGKLDTGPSPIRKLFEWLKGLGDGGSSGGGSDFLSGIFDFFGGRAGGGDARMGRMYRWRENEAEYFVPQENGTVITQAQLRGMASAGGGGDTYVFHVNGDVSAATVSLLKRAFDANNARQARSLRNGRASRLVGG